MIALEECHKLAPSGLTWPYGFVPYQVFRLTDYTMVAILDRPSNQSYSSRAGAAAYCVADDDTTTDK